MIIHKETEEEVRRRRSVLSDKTRLMAQKAIHDKLKKELEGRLGTFWVENPEDISRISLDLNASVSENGYGVLPSGSRIKIPEGKKIRAFTYWEKVNDIDLSCFGMRADGSTIEFSWRSMYRTNEENITFSGDQTRGYYGGSEYFDINIEGFQKEYPDCEYAIFCDNIFSDGGSLHFKDVEAKAGFMMRDEQESGEIFEPKTVSTSFKLNSDSSFSYMFAIDLKTREMVWLNLARKGDRAIAGTEQDMAFIRRTLNTTHIFNVMDLLNLCGERVENPEIADWIISDDPKYDDENVIRSWDSVKFLSLVQPG